MAKFAKRILVIDDEEANREALIEALSVAGYQAILSPNWQSAEAGLESMDYDVVVTEIFMAGNDGLHVIEEVRRRIPGTKVIAMAKKRQEVSQTKALKAAAKIGAEMTMKKPVDPDAVVEAVRSLVGGPSARATAGGG